MRPPATDGEGDEDGVKSGGVVDPSAADYGDDAIVVDLTADEKSQSWLDEEPEFRTIDELSAAEKERIRERARDEIDDA